jgi:hypothetical protein
MKLWSKNRYISMSDNFIVVKNHAYTNEMVYLFEEKNISEEPLKNASL